MFDIFFWRESTEFIAFFCSLKLGIDMLNDENKLLCAPIGSELTIWVGSSCFPLNLSFSFQKISVDVLFFICKVQTSILNYTLANQVLAMMLRFYNTSTRKKMGVKNLFTLFPFVGLLNAAVSIYVVFYVSFRKILDFWYKLILIYL